MKARFKATQFGEYEQLIHFKIILTLNGDLCKQIKDQFRIQAEEDTAWLVITVRLRFGER